MVSPFDDFRAEERFRAAWNAVEIVRPVAYSLFTFGESELPYFLVLEPKQPGDQVGLRQGMVRITRPLIITPDNVEPEFADFSGTDDDEDEDAAVVRYFLARTASFSHLKLNHQPQSQKFVSDSVSETVARLNRQLDAEDEDRIAILTAPARYASVAVMRYTAERVLQSTPGNITELREKGFLP